MAQEEEAALDEIPHETETDPTQPNIQLEDIISDLTQQNKDTKNLLTPSNKRSPYIKNYMRRPKEMPGLQAISRSSRRRGNRLRREYRTGFSRGIISGLRIRNI